MDATNSCNYCDEDLEIFTTCMVCDKPTKFQCSNCLAFVDDPAHTECMIFDESPI